MQAKRQIASHRQHRKDYDKYEISFTVKWHCDVTVVIVDEKGNVVQHVASGALGLNAPEPF